jgi:hypothetical protein
MFWEIREKESVPSFDEWIQEGQAELLIDRKILELIHCELERMGTIEREVPDHRTVTLEAALDVSTVDFANGSRPRQVVVLKLLGPTDETAGNDDELVAFVLRPI